MWKTTRITRDTRFNLEKLDNSKKSLRYITQKIHYEEKKKNCTWLCFNHISPHFCLSGVITLRSPLQIIVNKVLRNAENNLKSSSPLVVMSCCDPSVLALVSLSSRYFCIGSSIAALLLQLRGTDLYFFALVLRS